MAAVLLPASPRKPAKTVSTVNDLAVHRDIFAAAIDRDIAPACDFFDRT